MRIVGDLFQLGNIFTEISDAGNIIPTRAPLLSYHPDGYYQITLSLPSGYSLRYKYTLGDSFWNPERSDDFGLVTREITIPSKDALVKDYIETWSSGDSGDVTFRVSVPQSTDVNDTVSIQFRASDSQTIIPMWPLGNNRWFYVLHSPLESLGEISYRYCRNDQCGIADDSDTSGPFAAKNQFSASSSNQDISDEIFEWAWTQEDSEPTSVLAATVNPKQESFFTGIEFIPAYHPSWQSRIGYAFENIHNLGAKWAILSPTWTYTTSDPLQLEQVPGKDPLWNDLLQANQWASSSNLNIALFPVSLPSYNTYHDFWMNTSRDPDWWNSWFDRYRSFIIHNATLAAKSGAGAVILGEPGILPALPGGSLPDGTLSDVPDESLKRWESLIGEIRQIYNGEIIWVVYYDNEKTYLTEIINYVDKIYLVLSNPLSEYDNLTITEYSESFNNLLSKEIRQIKQQFNKPIIIALDYPSTNQSPLGCERIQGFCVNYENQSPLYNKTISVEVNLNEQMEIYNGALLAINQLDWIDGVVSRGYYPPAPLDDPSTSIHGKPAADVLWYWFHEFNK